MKKKVIHIFDLREGEKPNDGEWVFVFHDVQLAYNGWSLLQYSAKDNLFFGGHKNHCHRWTRLLRLKETIS